MARLRPAATGCRAGSTPEERAAAKAARRAANRARHRAAQEERAAATPPTLRQRRYLWCLGYRGPAPRNRAEVGAIIAALEADTLRRFVTSSSPVQPQ